ncbi:MAG: tetratricopeptide repeat protein [Smithella sp.]
MKKSLFTLSLIFLLFAPSIFAETVPDIPAGTAEEYYNRGNSFEKQGNLAQAISDYTNAIKVYSKYTKAYYNRGKAYGKQGNFSEAIADYNKAVEINPEFTEAYYNLGNAYEKQGNLSQAIVSYTKAIGINPKYAAAYCNRGNAYQAQGNLQKAIADYNKAIEINPFFAAAYSNRGNAYQIQGDFLQALADYNKAIEIKPEFGGFYSNRGYIYHLQGNLPKAIADYNKALEKNPNDILSLYNRGLAYYDIEQYGKSLADYATAVSKDPRMDAYEHFIKYFPAKKESDTGNVRNEIIQAFEEKLGKKIAAPVASAAPVGVPAPVGAPAPVAAPASVAAPAPVADVTGPVAVSEAVDAPAAGSNLAQTNDKQDKTKSIPENDVRILITKWLASWRSGDMKTYRSCYDESNFQSKGMNLDAWISSKADVYKKSKNIKINIDHLQISAHANTAKAVFTQNYQSSIFKYKGKKTLELRKIGDEWKIYKEFI